jgi:serine acetyltransferase
VVLGRIQADAALWKMPLFERWNAALLDRKADAMARGELLPRGNLLFTGNASLRREDYLAVGGFDASLPNSEDVELGLRLEKAGVQFRFCPDAPTLHGSDHTSLRKWRARAVRYGVCDQRIAKKHPELRHASPWRFVYELHRITLPFIALAVLLPRAASLLAGLSARFAELADRVGLRRIAHSGTTLAYATDYFRGVRDGAGSLRAALLELIDFAGRFEKRPFACAFLALCEDQAVMREYESRYGHAAPSEGRLAPDVVQKVGLQMMAAVRLMQGLHAAGRTTAAKIVSRVIRHLYGSDIHWEAQLEPGIMIVHGMGLAISREARVAHGCILFQHVTLGLGIDADTRKTGAPSLERDVHVGPGATLLGPITVGAGSKVMAGAVLTQPVPPGSLVETPAPQIRPRVPRVVSAA